MAEQHGCPARDDHRGGEGRTGRDPERCAGLLAYGTGECLVTDRGLLPHRGLWSVGRVVKTRVSPRSRTACVRGYGGPRNRCGSRRVSYCGTVC